jgi:predicted naringenin-chalcone synthase
MTGGGHFSRHAQRCPCNGYACAAELAAIREASDVLWLGQDPAVAVAVLEAHLDAA